MDCRIFSKKCRRKLIARYLFHFYRETCPLLFLKFNVKYITFALSPMTTTSTFFRCDTFLEIRLRYHRFFFVNICSIFSFFFGKFNRVYLSRTLGKIITLRPTLSHNTSSYMTFATCLSRVYLFIYFFYLKKKTNFHRSSLFILFKVNNKSMTTFRLSIR